MTRDERLEALKEYRKTVSNKFHSRLAKAEAEQLTLPVKFSQFLTAQAIK